MNQPDFFSSGGGQEPSPKRRAVQLQGPRPSPLKVRKESHKTQKPPPRPARREPVIIYSVSPKIIHADEKDFLRIVQRLTGPSLSSDDFSGGVSPAARLASVEKASPRVADRGREERTALMDEDIMEIIEGIDMGQIPGILSPAPASLPPISSGYFSTAVDSNAVSALHDFSPFYVGNSCFVPSPSTLLSAPLISPDMPYDLFSNNLFDF